VGNRSQQGHEDEIFVFSLMHAADGANGHVHHHGLQFCKLLDKSSPLLSNAINNNECLNMTFDIYRTNRYGRLEKYYLIEIRGAIKSIRQNSTMNDLHYEYISVDYDYILSRHLIAGTEFAYLLTPERYHQLFPVVQKTLLPEALPERKVTLVLGIFFDGTGNNAVNTRNMLEALTAQHFEIDGPDAASILARNASEKMGISGIGATSYLGYYTNIHWLNELYEQTFPPDSNYIQGAIYVEGIGTRAGEPDSLVGIGLGTAETGIIAKTDNAVAQLVKTIETTLASLKGKFVVDTLLFDIFGFSRGAQQPAILPTEYRLKTALLSVPSQQVWARLAIAAHLPESPDFSALWTPWRQSAQANGLDPHSADTGSVNIQLRPGVAQKVFHLTAQHECRYNFALNSIARDWPELALPGMHSDIGGGYLPQLREDLFLTRPLVETLPQNQPSAQSHVYQQAIAQLHVLGRSPAILPIIRTSKITPEIWEDDWVPDDHYSQRQKRTFAALTLRHRIVRFDWSKVALRVMFDAAVEAGAILADVDKASKHKLPEELKAFSDHARLMGKASRQGEKIAGFTTEEVNMIARKYIHCAAHWNAVELQASGDLRGGASASETIGFVNRPDNYWIRKIYNMDGI
jgi:type VI secretion system Hcp family effector